MIVRAEGVMNPVWRGAVWKVVGVVLIAGTGDAVAADADRIRRLEKNIEELQREIEELKAADEEKDLAASPEATESAIDALASRVELGGYGSLRFEESSADDVNSTFTFRRFVLTTDAAIAPKLRFYLELEFERFRVIELERSVEVEEGGLKVEQEIEGTAESEIAIEQVWLEYALIDQVRLRAGGVLVPLGRFNLNHDDNRWDLPRRSLVDRGVPVLPVKAAWNELGVGFAGDVAMGETTAVNYQLYVVNGATLEPEVEEIIQTRSESRDKIELEAKFTPFTGTFGNDVKDEKAVTGRIALSPALGHELGGSFYYGRYTPDFLPSEAIAAFGADGLSIWGPFEIEGEYIHSDFGDVKDVARAFAATARDQSAANPSDTNPNFEAEIEFEIDSLAESRSGYWVEPRYRFRPAWLKRTIFGRPFEDPVLTAVGRWEQAWIDGLLEEVEFSEGQVTELLQVDRRVDRFTIGGSYRPVPLVAFQLAYEYTRSDDGALSGATNFLATEDDEAHAILVGAAFGF
jgi:hypothetical protein